MFKTKVMLSYNYELFLGDWFGTVRKSLMEATNLLLAKMDPVVY